MNSIKGSVRENAAELDFVVTLHSEADQKLKIVGGIAGLNTSTSASQVAPAVRR